VADEDGGFSIIWHEDAVEEGEDVKDCGDGAHTLPDDEERFTCTVCGELVCPDCGRTVDFTEERGHYHRHGGTCFLYQIDYTEPTPHVVQLEVHWVGGGFHVFRVEPTRGWIRREDEIVVYLDKDTTSRAHIRMSNVLFYHVMIFGGPL
jgi:hypothetical protein